MAASRISLKHGLTTKWINSWNLRIIIIKTVDGYTKGDIVEVPVEDDKDIFCDGIEVVRMKVNANSKIPNLIKFAQKKAQEEAVRRISWEGSGAALTKVISCAEIMKRSIKKLHQLTRIKYKRIEEYWEPSSEGLERLKVNRDIPYIVILLSKDPLDPSLSGYQSSDRCDVIHNRMSHDGRRKRGREGVAAEAPGARYRGQQAAQKRHRKQNKENKASGSKSTASASENT